MLIISLGRDCTIANLCKELDVRTIALPFDFAVGDAYGHLITNKFENFTKEIDFVHHDINDKIVLETFKRRIKRLYELIDSDEEIHFVRKSHSFLEHDKLNIQDEIDDLIKLDQYLKINHSKLIYKIHLLDICESCKSSKKDDNIFHTKFTRNTSDKYISDVLQKYHQPNLSGKQLRNIVLPETTKFHKEIQEYLKSLISFTS